MDALQIPAGLSYAILFSAILGLVILMMTILAGYLAHAGYRKAATGLLMLAVLLAVGTMFYQNIFQPYGFAEFWHAVTLYRTGELSQISLLANAFAKVQWALVSVPYAYPLFAIYMAFIIRKMDKQRVTAEFPWSK